MNLFSNVLADIAWTEPVVEKEAGVNPILVGAIVAAVAVVAIIVIVKKRK